MSKNNVNFISLLPNIGIFMDARLKKDICPGCGA